MTLYKPNPNDRDTWYYSHCDALECACWEASECLRPPNRSVETGKVWYFHAVTTRMLNSDEIEGDYL